MDNQAIYNEKKLAFFESTYRESVLSKPQDVNVTITAEHIYGLAYICEQTGTREEDPVYSRFTCGLEEITKIYINNNNKNSPIYVQCDDTSKAVINRRRIILPCFKNNTEIVQMIENAKNELDKKLSARREKEKSEKLKAMKRAADDEFEKLTGGYKDLKKNAEKAASEAASKAATEAASKAAAEAASKAAAEAVPKAVEAAPKAVEAAPKAETKPEPAPAPVPKAEPRPAPAPAPAPKAEAKPEPKRAPAPAPAPKPEVRSIDAAPKKSSLPKPDTEFVFESTRTIPEPENKGPVTVDDLMDLNEFLGISPEDVAAAKAKASPGPAAAPKAEAIPEPAAAPKAETKPEPAPAPKAEAKPAPAPAPKAEPAPAPAPAPKAEAKPEPVIEELALPSEDLMDVVKVDEIEIESIPVEVVQKNVAEIEDLVVPDISAMGEIREAKIVTKPTRRQQMAAEAEGAANTVKSLTPGVAQPPKKRKDEQPSEAKEAAAVEVDDDNDIMKRSGVDVSLDDFETAVKKLKTMLDNGLITEAEFAGEKKKLLSLLY